jgi:hypothetical protein
MCILNVEKICQIKWLMYICSSLARKFACSCWLLYSDLLPFLLMLRIMCISRVSLHSIRV